MNYDDFLAHFGIKGMKWGIRRSPEQLGRKSSSKSDAGKEDVSKMSDQELRSRLNRLQMEQQYKQLSSNSISSGKKTAQKILKASSKVIVKGVTVVGIYEGEKYLSNKFNTNPDLIRKHMKTIKAILG